MPGAETSMDTFLTEVFPKISVACNTQSRTPGLVNGQTERTSLASDSSDQVVIAGTPSMISFETSCQLRE